MIQSRMSTWVRGFVVLVAVVVSSGLAWGAELEKRPPAQPADQGNAASTAKERYWLGILGAPADALLKSHLRLEGGVVVEQVVPDSPASKAGILIHDILIQFGDAKLTDVEGLQKAVEANKDREAKVALLRAGEEKTVTVKPGLRPADASLAVPAVPGDWGQIGEMFKGLERGGLGQDPLRMFFVQPGLVVPKELKERHVELFTTPPQELRLPKNTRVTITRKDEEPAKITVEKDGQKWEVAETELDKLPADIRPAVKGMLGGGRVFVFGQGSVVMPGERPGRPDAGETPKVGPEKRPDGKPDPAANEVDKVRKKMEDMTRQLHENEKRMQKQLDELRQQLEKLGQQKI